MGGRFYFDVSWKGALDIKVARAWRNEYFHLVPAVHALVEPKETDIWADIADTILTIPKLFFYKLIKSDPLNRDWIFPMVSLFNE